MNEMDDVNNNLFIAIGKGFEDVKKLLDNGCDINVRNEDDNTPLIVAIQGGNIDIIRLLIEQGADVNAVTASDPDETILAMATRKTNNKNIIKLLLDKGANVNTNYGIKSLICDAINTKDEEIVNMFIVKFAVNFGTLDNDTKADLLYSAAASGNEKIVQIILDHGVDANCTSSFDYDAPGPLIAAAISGNEKVIQILFERGGVVSSVTDDGNTALYEAIKKRSVKSVELLLSHEATRETEALYEHKTALLAALSANEVQEEMVQLLLDHGADVHAITSPSQREITEHWCTYGNEGDPRTSDDETTTLHYAARSGNEEVFKMILDRGVSPLAKNFSDKSVLHFAAKGGNEGIVRALLDLGADIHAKDTCDNTFLHFAAAGGNEKIVQLALDSGICVNSTSKIGQTPLHVACLFGFDHVIKFILRYNPNLYTTFTDPSKFDFLFYKEKPTKAINLAVESNNNENCVNLLLNCGINVNEGIENELYQTSVESALELFGFYKRRYAVEDCEQMKKTTILEQLLVYGAKADGARIESGFNYLSGAIHRYCVELLVSYAENINSLQLLQGLQGRTSTIHPELRDILRERTIVQHLVLHGIKADIIERHDCLKNFQVNCEQEIDKLKSKVFENSTVTYYDFIATKDQNQLAWYTRNSNIVKVFTTGELKTNFPIYALTLKSNFRKGMWRRLMLDRVKRFFHAVAESEGNQGLPKLPFNCIKFILELLSNKDLRMLILVCDPVNGFNIDVNM